jgi:ATP-dependent 26S proteasome regulatory subunit
LPNGIYTHERPSPYDDLPERLVPTEIRNDRTVFLPNNYQSIVEDIKSFLNPESYDIDKELGIQHRLGILLYGPPGTGKTTLIRSIIKDVIPKDSVVIFMEHLFSRGMNKKLRECEDGRLKVLVYEELASTVENVKIDRLLDFLDGEKSLNNTLVLATTNYPEKLPANIVDRPGRFDRLHKIGDPNKETRKILLEFYLSRAPSEKEVSMSEGMSAAAIKELCLMMRRGKKEMSEVIDQMKKHSELVKKEFKESRAIGFNSTRDPYSIFDDDD